MKQSSLVAMAALALSLAGGVATAGEQREVRFARGATSAVVNGAVVRGDRDHYTIGVGKGQILTLSIRSEEDNAVFDVFQPGYKVAADGEVEGRALATESKQTNVRLPSAGRYLIVVGGTRGNAQYRLQVAVTNSGE